MNKRKWYDRDILAHVIRRAHDIDVAREDRLSEQDVREIAAELNISPESVCVALNEIKSPQAKRSASLGGLRLAAASVLSGIASGLVMCVAGQRYGIDGALAASFPAMAAMFLTNAVTAAKVSGSWRVAKYQAINLVTWAGFGVALLPLFYAMNSAAVGATIGAVLGSVVLGVRSLRDRGQSKRSGDLLRDGSQRVVDVQENDEWTCRMSTAVKQKLQALWIFETWSRIQPAERKAYN